MFAEPMEETILPFEGEVAFFSIFDSVIKEGQVESLWNAQIDLQIPDEDNSRMNVLGIILGSVTILAFLSMSIAVVVWSVCPRRVPPKPPRDEEMDVDTEESYPLAVVSGPSTSKTD